MGWISDDELHEGYVEVVLVDGATSSTSNSLGPVVMGRDTDGHYTGEDVQHADDEVVGWRVCCDCSSATVPGRMAKWSGPYFERVATAALEDLDQGRLYLREGDHASDVMDEGPFAETARARWLAEHVAPEEALGAIARAREEIQAANARLDEAVTYARASGKSWTDIGHAAGMRRQSAHDRWANGGSA